MRKHLTRLVIAAAVLLAAIVVVPAYRNVLRDRPLSNVSPTGTTAAEGTDKETSAAAGLIYGRIHTVNGEIYEGRLRWGGDQEASWDDFFNGTKSENPWSAYADRKSSPFEIFGVEIGGRDRRFDRLFMARFGDLARIDRSFKTVEVRLKSGTMVQLDRFAAGDIDDGVRVWDRQHGMVDVDSGDIRSIEFLPTVSLRAAPARLHGTVHTRHGDFSGFVGWDQQDVVGTDEFTGHSGGSDVVIRYDTIRSIARQAGISALVTLTDGRQMSLSDSRDVGNGHRGIYVDDDRYGRVLVSWDAFERIEFSPGATARGYADFAPGRPLTGHVTTRDGRRLAGRLVYDFDESETTETLDTSVNGVDYNIPFRLIASIRPSPGQSGDARPIVRLRGGEELQVDAAGDLGSRNTGLLIFADGRERPDRVPWTDVAQIDLD